MIAARRLASRVLPSLVVLGTLACEGATFRCDPSPSWSVRRDDPGLDAGFSYCRGDCAATDLSLGERHTCAVVGPLGEVVCFGANDARQSSPRDDAAEVPPSLVGQRARTDAAFRFGHVLAAGAIHGCAIFDGTVSCWGSAAVLGAHEPTLPVTTTLAGAIHVESGSAHVGALVFDEAVGFSEWFFFGAWNGFDSRQPAPLLVPERRGAFTSLGLGGFTTWEVLVISDRFARYGDVPPPGPLSEWRRSAPLFADPPEDASSYAFCGHCNSAVGPLHACSLRTGTGMSCAGRNDRGQLGRGPPTTVFDDRFLAVPGLADLRIARACAGGSLGVRDEGGEVIVGAPSGGHTCATDDGGTTWCWGANDRGQLGDRTFVDRIEPVRVDVPPLVVLRCGGEHTCGLDEGGTIWCWGDNRHGQLGVPSSVIDRGSGPRIVTVASAE